MMGVTQWFSLHKANQIWNVIVGTNTWNPPPQMDSNPLPLTKIQTHYHWQRFKPTTTDKDSNPLPLTKIQTHYHSQRFKPTTTHKDSNPPSQFLSHYIFNMQTTTSFGDFQVEIKASFVLSRNFQVLLENLVNCFILFYFTSLHHARICDFQLACAFEMSR